MTKGRDESSVIDVEVRVPYVLWNEKHLGSVTYARRLCNWLIMLVFFSVSRICLVVRFVTGNK